MTTPTPVPATPTSPQPIQSTQGRPPEQHILSPAQSHSGRPPDGLQHTTSPPRALSPFQSYLGSISPSLGDTQRQVQPTTSSADPIFVSDPLIIRDSDESGSEHRSPKHDPPSTTHTRAHLTKAGPPQHKTRPIGQAATPQPKQDSQDENNTSTSPKLPRRPQHKGRKPTITYHDRSASNRRIDHHGSDWRRNQTQKISQNTHNQGQLNQSHRPPHHHNNQ